MSVYKELAYEGEIDTVHGIQFSVMSPEEIEKRSVAEIFKTDTFNGNEPVPNGLFDKRMGVIDHDKVCVTCGQKNAFCPGHFGHIKLAKPVYHVQFYPVIRNTLKCVCLRCSKLLIGRETPEVKALLARKGNRQKRFETIFKLTNNKVRHCGQFNPDGCGAKVVNVVKDGILRLAFEWKDAESKAHEVVSVEDVHKILRRITDKDAEILGFSKTNRPENMICSMLPVPPPAVRPSVRNDTGQRSEDDLTHKLSSIIKINNNIASKLEKNGGNHGDLNVEGNHALLQYDVATLIDNTQPGVPPSQQRTGRPMRSLTERLKGKEGRIRGNLMGKRVDFSARSVITPDPNISIDELGVPVKIASNLTFPEVVRLDNLVEVQQLVRNGPDLYPGAKYVKKLSEQRTVRLQSTDREALAQELQPGDIVERHLRDGDVILFNRQPSLHKVSMMAHRIRVMPFQTFRLNVMVTPAFNADFDGDEMNMHVPQSYQTHEELLQLAAVPKQIISPREATPIVSVVQDIVLGLYQMTKPHVRVSEKHFMNLMVPNPKCMCAMPTISQPEYSGRQVLSSIIPVKISLESQNNQFDEGDGPDRRNSTVVSIRNGQIHSGTFDKGVYQRRTMGLVHSIFNECGPDETRLFLDNTQQLVCNWLVLNGFSVGVSDMIVDKQTNFIDEVHKMKKEVYSILHQIHSGTYESNGKVWSLDFERQVNNKLNKAVKTVGDIATAEINENSNRLINMIRSKSKGTALNVSQMIGLLGQQNVEDKRIPDGFDFRTLPHFTKYDDGPESRGFVEHSFIQGLTPQEFFFHAMGGREGLINTAVGTSEVGYIQRKLVKAMEDCKVYHDGSVRNANGSIIQFLYGDDGMDCTKIESQIIPYATISAAETRVRYSFSMNNVQELKELLTDKAYADFLSDSSATMQDHVEQILEDREFVLVRMFKGRLEKTVFYPVSLHRIIHIAKTTLHATSGITKSDLTPAHVLHQLQDLCDSLYVNKEQPGNGLFHILLRAYLSPKEVIMRHQLTRATFDYIVSEIRLRFLQSLVHPSEMVGVVAAQSIGEPATQLTLDTFHSAGVSSGSAAVRGVPRLKELLSFSKKMKTPAMHVYFEKTDKESCVKHYMHLIKTVRFRDIIRESSIHYDPNDRHASDQAFIKEYHGFDMGDDDGKKGPWVLRLVLSKAAMVEHKVDMHTLHQRLLEFYGSHRISVIMSDQNSSQLVMRIKLLEDGDKKMVLNQDDLLTEIKAFEASLLDNVSVKGIPGIERAFPESDKVKVSNMSEYNPLTKEFDTREEWKVVTDGSNLADILALPEVDPRRTYTNNIIEIYEVLGIEAVRNALYNEIMLVLEATHVDYRHIAMLVDIQTNKGTLYSIDRHGINRGDIGPLAKCSFEETTEKLIKAGIFTEYDRINGVSANIMLGQIAPAGTGDCEVLMDETKLFNKRLEAIPEADVDEEAAATTTCFPETFTLASFVPPIITPSSSERVANEVVSKNK